MPTKSVTRDFMLDPDQVSRREELDAFIGPDSEKFSPIYESWRARASHIPGQKKPKLARGFITMAFFLGPAWFFYRKLWLWAIGLTVLLIALGYVPYSNRLGLPMAIAMSLFGRLAYLDYAIKKIVVLRGSASMADLGLLQREGGVSKIAGWISGTIIVVITILALISLFFLTGLDGGSVARDI